MKTNHLPQGTLNIVADAIQNHLDEIGYGFGAIVKTEQDIADAVTEGASREALVSVARAAIGAYLWCVKCAEKKENQ